MSKPLVLVIEDDRAVSEDIQKKLKKLGYGVSSSPGDEAIEHALEVNPRLVLMDVIQTGRLNGIEIAQRIKDALNIPVVYLTERADKTTLEKTKITEPYGYLIKPIDQNELKTAVVLALEKHKLEQERRELRSLISPSSKTGNRADFVFVKSNSRLVKLNTSEIYFVEALKDYVVINTLNTRFTIHSTMKHINEKLPSEEFMRVHRSFIVRLDKIAAIEQPNLILENDKKVIPIGGSYKEELQKRIRLV